jgi:hypothetical protein
MTKLNLSKKIFLMSLIGIVLSVFHVIWINNIYSLKLLITFFIVAFLSIWYHSILIIKNKSNELDK